MNVLLAIGLWYLKREDYFFEYPVLCYDDWKRNSDIEKRLTCEN